jgi:SAM-dependent methyltransferase
MDHAQFTEIAKYYDELMAGVPYRLWVEYLLDLLERVEFKPRTILDVACGTGNVSEILSARGYEVVGADIAPGMIEAAKAKHSRVEYHVSDMAELHLTRHPEPTCHPELDSGSRGMLKPVQHDAVRQFDLAISLFDSLNYITDPDHLARAIERVGEHVVEGGYFIFDVNTIYALAHHFFDQANLASDRYPHYIWSSEYDHSTRICTIKMTFEVLQNGEPRQFVETHYQRGHSLEELSQWLIDAGFEVVDVFHAYRFRKPTRRSDRVFYVARKAES